MLRALGRASLVAAVIVLSACAPSAQSWAKQPDRLRPAFAYQTLELLLDEGLLSTSPRPYTFPLTLQNNSDRWVRYARFDATAGTWVGEGLTVRIQVTPERDVGSFAIDYAPVSRVRLSPNGRTGSARSPQVTLQPKGDVFVPGDLSVTRAIIAVTWVMQDRSGNPVMAPISAQAYTTFGMLGLAAPTEAVAARSK